jgi:hypothetical protein
MPTPRGRLLWVLALLIGSGSAVAADKPDFSGEWKLNAESSFYGTAPEPASLIRKITHKDPSLIITEEQEMNGQKQVFARTMTTDGKPADQQIMGTSVTCSAVWDGSALIVTSKAPEFGVVYNDHMTLSADGKTLTSKVQVSSPQGDMILLIVFDKQ